MKKISIVSSSRADYGILKNLIIKLQKDRSIKLNFYVTGSHLSSNFGKTIKEIYRDKLKISKKIPMSFGNGKNINMSKVISQGITNFSKIFYKDKSDLIIILGDRYEIFSVAIAAMVCQVPIAHLHGGELTKGAIDESIRHSISKMSHIHFVSTKEYYKRLIQLGEKRNFVFNVGSLGVENTKKIKLLSIDEIKKNYNIDFKKDTFIITLHPETLKAKNTKRNVSNLLSSLKNFKNYNFVFTMPSAEQGYNIINNEIINFCKKNKNSFYFKSLGQQAYFSFCKNASCVIGNSSSAIIEIPSLLTPSLDLGIRQMGRLRAASVLNTDFSKKKIIQSVKKCLKLKKLIQKKKFKYENPYEKKNTSSNILKIIKSFNLNNILTKEFKDLKF